MNTESIDSILVKELSGAYLPLNYDFEIEKTAQRILKENAEHIALQLPEGLLCWAPQIAAILEKLSSTLKRVTIIGDATYGACCVDDLSSAACGADLLIHYGHSCLVPAQETQGSGITRVQTLLQRGHNSIKTFIDFDRRKPLSVMYVFVDIFIDPYDLQAQIKQAFNPQDQIILAGSVQFSKIIQVVRRLLEEEKYFFIPPKLPQRLPLTSGEVLGCTSPKLEEIVGTPNNYKPSTDIEDMDKATDPTGIVDVLSKHGLEGAASVLFVADGRFHLESLMIQNPRFNFIRYDPFTKVLFKESYNHNLLLKNRQAAADRARSAKRIAILCSTIGRQASVGIVEDIRKKLEDICTTKGIRFCTILMGEISPIKLDAIGDVDAFIQVGCPRLSIDWGSEYNRPVLNPYEAFVSFGGQPFLNVYPMDYYARDGGRWSNYNTSTGQRSGSLASPLIHNDRKDELRARLAQRRLLKKAS